MNKNIIIILVVKLFKTEMYYYLLYIICIISILWGEIIGMHFDDSLIAKTYLSLLQNNLLKIL